MVLGLDLNPLCASPQLPQPGHHPALDPTLQGREGLVIEVIPSQVGGTDKGECWHPVYKDLWLHGSASRVLARVVGSWRVRLGAQDTWFSSSSRSSSLETPGHLGFDGSCCALEVGTGQVVVGLESSYAWPSGRLGPQAAL